MPEETQKIFDLLTELWNGGRLEIAEQLYSDQAERTDPNQMEAARGVQQIASYVAEVRAAFPDFKLQITKRIGEGDQIASEWTCSGTHRGTFLGIPPTGRRVEIHGVTLNRLQGGKIAEERVYFDRLSMLQQLGVAAGAAEGQAAAAG